MSTDTYLDREELAELLEVAQRIDPNAEVLEKPTDIDGREGWVLTVRAPNIPFIETRCADQYRGRRLVITSLVELLGERGLLRVEEYTRPPDLSHDPEYVAYRQAKERDASILAELESVLSADESEESVQKCIEKYPRLWAFATQGPPCVVAKMKLGEAFVTDFLIFGAARHSQIQMPMATFVEIERPSYRLFTRSGDDSAELRHGLRQLRDWRYWVSENRQYLRDRLVERIPLGWKRWSREGQPVGLPPYGFAEQYLLVIGRRKRMSPMDRLRLQRLNEEQPNTKTMTFDMLIDALVPEDPWPPPWDL